MAIEVELDHIEKARRMLLKMYEGNPIELTDPAKKELDEAFSKVYESYEGSEGTWYITSINSDLTAQIVSETHLIFESAPQDWFKI